MEDQGILKQILDKVIKKSGKTPKGSSTNETSTNGNYDHQQPTSSTQNCSKYQHLFDSLDDIECVQVLKSYFLNLGRAAAKDISTESKEKIDVLIFKLHCDKLPIDEFLNEINKLLSNVHYMVKVNDFTPFFSRTVPLYRIYVPITAQCKTYKKVDKILKKMSDHQDALIQSNIKLAKKIFSLEQGCEFHGLKKEEEALVLTFGLDESSLALRQFIDHYQLAREANMKNRIDGWNDPSFRAYKLCFQLRNQAASWVFREMCSRKGLANHDDEIIAILREKYLDEFSIEEKIMKFEQLEQEDGESLPTYMQRCQNYGELAFSGFGENSMHQRVVWKFISGIKDVEVKSAVMASKWMLHQSEAKPCLEILKRAELETEKVAFIKNELKCSAHEAEGDNSSLTKKRNPSSNIADARKIPKTNM